MTERCPAPHLELSELHGQQPGHPVCPECGQEIDEHGNTPDQLDYCPFPYCGCDGARNCMAREGPNLGSQVLNPGR